MKLPSASQAGGQAGCALFRRPPVPGLLLDAGRSGPVLRTGRSHSSSTTILELAPTFLASLGLSDTEKDPLVFATAPHVLRLLSVEKL